MYTIKKLLDIKGVYLDNITLSDKKNHLIDYTLTDDNIIQYINSAEEIIATLDINIELQPKFLEKGVFYALDCHSNKTITLQFYKHLPLNLSE